MTLYQKFPYLQTGISAMKFKNLLTDYFIITAIGYDTWNYEHIIELNYGFLDTRFYDPSGTKPRTNDDMIYMYYR
jgi:hypothetical protein